MSDLKAAIRKALAGSTSQRPLDTKKLLPLGDSTAISLALGEMLDTREINTAQSIKGGITTVWCWLTGASGLAPTAFLRQYPPMQLPAATMRQPVTNMQPTASIIQPKENAMPLKANPITEALVKIITEQPGINQDALIESALELAPDSTYDKAKKALANLQYSSKKVRVQLIDGDRCYFLNDGKRPAKAKAKPAKPSAAKAVKPAAPAAPARVQLRPAPEPETEHAAAPRDDFSIMLDESNCVRIKIGTVTSVLKPEDAERVYCFIGRVHKLLEAASA